MDKGQEGVVVFVVKLVVWSDMVADFFFFFRGVFLLFWCCCNGWLMYNPCSFQESIYSACLAEDSRCFSLCWKLDIFEKLLLHVGDRSHYLSTLTPSQSDREIRRSKILRSVGLSPYPSHIV